MKANEILALPARQVESRWAIAFFNLFVKHFNLTDEEIPKAWSTFERLQKMDITLDLALNTAVAMARW